MRRLVLALLALAPFVACGTDEGFSPGVGAGGGTTEPPVQPPKDASVADALAVKRTVIVRNPFGNVQAKQNLLWDGDFEWHSKFAQQYGWVNASFLVSVEAFDQVIVGPRCRSGMKCGLLTQNQRIAGVGVSPGDVPVSASVWVHVPGPDCAGVSASIIACDYAVDEDVGLADADGQPDADGWCHYEGVSAPRKRATCLFLDAEFSDGEAVVDDAVVLAAPGANPSSRALTPGQQKHADQARKLIRERLRPGPPVREERVDALERWARRKR